MSATCLLRHFIAYVNVFAQHPKPRKNLPYLPFLVVSDNIISSNMKTGIKTTKT